MQGRAWLLECVCGLGSTCRIVTLRAIEFSFLKHATRSIHRGALEGCSRKLDQDKDQALRVRLLLSAYASQDISGTRFLI